MLGSNGTAIPWFFANEDVRSTNLSIPFGCRASGGSVWLQLG
jgi:hypothetical protein